MGKGRNKAANMAKLKKKAEAESSSSGSSSEGSSSDESLDAKLKARSNMRRPVEFIPKKTVKKKSVNDELAPLLRHLREVHHLEHVPITADGNCFFRAVSRILYGTEVRHMELRKEACDWMMNNLDKIYNETRYTNYDDSSGREGPENPWEHVERMRKPGEYADAAEVKATHNALRRSVHIYYSISEEPHKFNYDGGATGPPIILLRTNGSSRTACHYSALRPISDGGVSWPTAREQLSVDTPSGLHRTKTGADRLRKHPRNMNNSMSKSGSSNKTAHEKLVKELMEKARLDPAAEEVCDHHTGERTPEIKSAPLPHHTHGREIEEEFAAAAAATTAAGGKKRGRSNAGGAETGNADETPLPVLVFTREMKDKNRTARIEGGDHPGPRKNPEAGMVTSLSGEELCTFYSLKARIIEQSTVYKKGTLAYALYTSAGKTLPLDLTVEKLNESKHVWEGVLVIKFESNMSPEEQANFRDIVANNDYQYGLLDGMKEKFDELVKKAYYARDARNPSTGSYTFFVEEKEGGLLAEYDAMTEVKSGVGEREKGTRLSIDHILSCGDKGVPWLGGRITIIAVENSKANDLRKKYGETEGRTEELARLVEEYKEEYKESLNHPMYYVTDDNDKLLNGGEPFTSIKGLVEKVIGSTRGLKALRTKLNEAGLGATKDRGVSRWIDKDRARGKAFVWEAPDGRKYTIRGHNEA